MPLNLEKEEGRTFLSHRIEDVHKLLDTHGVGSPVVFLEAVAHSAGIVCATHRLVSGAGR